MKTAAQTYKNVSRAFERDQLILDHLPFVRHVLGKLIAQLPDGIDVENLESAGILGLVEAARQFDEDRGTAFTTFAYPRIRGAILDELRRNCPLPQQALQRVTKIRRACEILPPPITPEALAKQTGLSTAEVEESLEAMRLTHFESWDEAVSAGGHHGSQAEQPAAEAELSETKQVLTECIAALPEKERLVITLYYLEDLRLKEIGDVLKLSESRVSRILAKAQFRLQQAVRARGG